MSDTPRPGLDQKGPTNQHDQHDQHDGQHDIRHHPPGRPHHRGGGRPGYRLDVPGLLPDQPVGTSPEALTEAFFGVGQLLRGSARFHRRRPRHEGLTFARAALLAALDTDGPQRMGQLAHRLGVVPRTVTPMVDALEADGLLLREADPEDRRATLLRITDAGVAELTRTRSDRRNAVDEVFAGLSDEERNVLASVLDTLRTAARAVLSEPAEQSAERPSEDAATDRQSGSRPGRPEGRGRGRGRGPQRHPGHHGGPRHWRDRRGPFLSEDTR